MLDAKEINIETTNLCQAHCLMCPRDKFTQKLMHMDMSLFKKIIDDAVANGYTSLTLCLFGDPLLDPYLKERCEYVKKKSPQMTIFLSSTCHALTKEMASWICELVDFVKISIFGVTPETYKIMHGKLDFERSFENIMNLVREKEKRGEAEISPHLCALFIATEHNMHEQQAWIDYWEPLLDEVMVWTPHNWHGEFEYRKPTVQRKTCGRPFNGEINVGVDGRVTICCLDYNKIVTLGDLNVQTISEVRNTSDVLKDICEIHRTLAFEHCEYPCATCDQTYIGYDGVLLYSTDKERKVGMGVTKKAIYTTD